MNYEEALRKCRSYARKIDKKDKVSADEAHWLALWTIVNQMMVESDIKNELELDLRP